MEAKLKVVDGAKGAIIRLKLPTTIGRGSESSLKVPSSQVSRSHCEIYEEDGLLAVDDLGSSNGTFINGEKIVDPTFLYPGDLLRVGNVKLEAIYKADRSLVAEDAADEDADTGVTEDDTAAAVAAVKKKAAADKEASEKSASKDKAAKKETAKESKPEPEKEVAQPAATKEEVEGFDLDEALGIEPENESPDIEEVEPETKPKPAPAPKKPAAKKPAAKKPAAKKPAKPAAKKKAAAASADAADSEKEAGLSGVSAIVDYEENESGSFIAIDAIDGAESPANVSSFNIDVGEDESPADVSGISLDTGEEDPQSAVGSSIFKFVDEDRDDKSAIDGGDSALNDFFDNLE